MIRKLFPAFAVLIALVVTMAGCSSTSEEAPATAVISPPPGLVAEGSLTYGVAASFPPFEWKENAQPVGFDIDMGKEIAGYFGLRPKILDIDFDGLIPALQGGRVDIINSAMYINSERSQKVDFVPYMKIGETFIGRKDANVVISKLPGDLSGKTISVTRGAIGETYMNQFNDQLKAAGLPPMHIMALPTNQDALLAVQSGRSDAFDTSTPGAAHTISQTGGKMVVLTTFAQDTQIGIAVPKNKPELKSAIESAMKRFIDTGKYDELAKKYHLPTDAKVKSD